MKILVKLILISCLPYWVAAQTYPDHYGTGQYQGVTVTSSNEGIVAIKNLALSQPTSQSSDYSSSFLSSNANDGNLNTMNHTKNLASWNGNTAQNIQNLALNKPTAQSSYAFNSPASNANDGDISTFNHTADSLYSWWEVDLGAISNIASIEVFDREGSYNSRLNNFYVFVSDTPFTSDNPITTAAQIDIDHHFTATALDVNTFDINRTGRYVRIQLAGQNYLHLGEVRVLGEPIVKAWWEVDLGTTCDITDIEILNRTDCCGFRLNNFYLLVSDTPFESDYLDKSINQASVSSYFTEVALDVNTIAVNRTGRFVRVQLDSDYPLHMTEVRVLGREKENTGINTVNGTGTLPNLADASRFLSQATLGHNYEEIEKVSQMGIDAWLEEQFELPPASYTDTLSAIADSVQTIATEASTRGTNDYLSFTFYKMLFDEPDALRQKVAFSLSQTIVASYLTQATGARSYGAAAFYDILYQNAFGNYRDILQEVTRSTYMGKYLTYYQNSKADFGQGSYPDENYAREIMQLFSIGLLELNNDGTVKLDNDGNTIPTYDIKDIEELAKVFTGFASNTNSFTADNRLTDYALPMGIFEEYHDTQEKTMINGVVLPAGQTLDEDVTDAVDILFNHPNVGPFIGTRLIQHLVKSNPSPAYVNRVANAFNDNGQGVRGDLGAVVKAILSDPEARTCNATQDAKAGKLIQPLERFTKLFIGFDIYAPSGKLWLNDFGSSYAERLEQSFMASPSVFNFFSPFYAESKHVAANDMVSPEFQNLHSTSGIYYLNMMEDAIKNFPIYNYTSPHGSLLFMYRNTQDYPVLSFNDEINIMENQGLSALIDRLDILLCRGQLSIEARAVIESTIQQYQANVDGYTDADAVKDVIYLIMVSPDFMILK